MQTGAYGVTPPVRPDFFTPGGYLTLVSGTPVPSSDQSGKTVLYYTHDKHAYFPVIKNGVIVPVHFPDELLLTLSNAHAANSIYDIFGVEQNGKGRIVTGTAWATATAGSGDRGTTPGQPELTRAAGLYVNRWGMAGLSAEGSCFIPPLGGTYFGTIAIGSSAGQLTCHVASGQSRVWGVWNAYNRRKITLKNTDSTASWFGSTSVYRSTNNSTANKVTVLCGLAEEVVKVTYNQYAEVDTAAGSGVADNQHHIAISKNSTGASVSGKRAKLRVKGANISAIFQILNGGNLLAELEDSPFIGINFYTAAEGGATNASLVTVYGGEDDMLMVAEWMG